MGRIKIEQAYEGEWVAPKRQGFIMRCCDCGLVHRVNFRTVRHQIQFQTFREPKRTGSERRRFPKRVRTWLRKRANR